MTRRLVHWRWTNYPDSPKLRYLLIHFEGEGARQYALASCRHAFEKSPKLFRFSKRDTWQINWKGKRVPGLWDVDEDSDTCLKVAVDKLRAALAEKLARQFADVD